MRMNQTPLEKLNPDTDYVDGGEDIENDGTGSDASSFSDAREPLLNLKSRTSTSSQNAVVGAKVYPIESLDYEYEHFHLLALLCIIANYVF